MSLITFRSPTQGSVIMFSNDAYVLLEILGLPAQGEIACAELATYQQRLSHAIEADKADNPIVWPETDTPEQEAPVIVRLSQRAIPLVQLMKRCIAATETIHW